MLPRVILAGIFCSSCVAHTSALPPQVSTTTLDDLVSQYESKNLPGVSVLVVQDGKELYRRSAGMANVEYNIPISKDSVFHVASVSKQFTAFAACLLEQEGKLNLDDDVRKYLPELPDYGTKITLRNLATHTSGLRDFYDLNDLVGFTESNISTNDQILKLLFQQKHLNFTPNSNYEYGNSSFTLLGEIISRVAQKPLAQFLKDRVFLPLGMANTLVVDDPEIIIPNRAYSYHAPGGVLYKRLLGPVNVGSTGINTTADDLVRWSQNFEHPKVGSQKIFDRMSERNKHGNGYALGQQFKNYRGLEVVYHGGGDAGYRAYLLRIPTKNFTVVVLGNSREFFPIEIAYTAVDTFLFNGPPAAQPPTNLNPALLKSFVGDYELFPGTIVRITTENDKLYVQNYGDSTKAELPQVTNNEFNYPIFSSSKFVFDESKTFHWQLFDMIYPATKLNLTPFNPATANLQELVGTYYSPELNDEYTLKIIDGNLVASHRRNPNITLTPIQKDWLHGNTHYFAKIIPTRDGSGKINGLHVSAQRAHNIHFQKVPPRPRT